MRRETEESQGRSKEIIETKPGSEATMRSHVFSFPNPHFPQVSSPQDDGSRMRLAFTM